MNITDLYAKAVATTRRLAEHSEAQPTKEQMLQKVRAALDAAVELEQHGMTKLADSMVLAAADLLDAAMKLEA